MRRVGVEPDDAPAGDTQSQPQLRTRVRVQERLGLEFDTPAGVFVLACVR
jgi:hypothetical protein